MKFRRSRGGIVAIQKSDRVLESQRNGRLLTTKFLIYMYMYMGLNPTRYTALGKLCCVILSFCCVV